MQTGRYRLIGVVLLTACLVEPAQAQTKPQVGGTGSVANTGTADSVMVGDGDSYENSVLPNCPSVNGHINFATASDTFTCNLTQIIQSGANPTISGAGALGIDTTAGQFVYHDGTAERVIGYKMQLCATKFNVAAADDNLQFWSTLQGVTITDFWCRYEGTGTTVATFTLEDSNNGAMTHTSPTCVTGAANATIQSVTALNTMVAGEGLRVDTTNTPSPTTDDYTLCVAYTVDRQ